MKIRLRKDLIFYQRDESTNPTWVVKDPLSFNHYLFSSGEHFLLHQFDGSRTEDDVIQSWRERFKTSSLSVEQLRQFVRRLIHDNLVVVDQLGMGRLSSELSARQPGKLPSSWLRNPLAIRFRGVNPTPVLQQFDWLGHLLFHPLSVGVVLCASLAILVYMFGHFEDVAVRIPAMEQLLSRQGLIGLVITLAIVKVLHELGHGLACRKFGGECFEIGVILLVFIPTLYCNVSDAWTFRERWKRIMVSFAGMYVEIILAALAAVCWLLTPPSFLNALLFNVVALCSINTILINGNPLLRYDGYYMLADWWEKPNLSQSANRAVSRFWLSSFLSPAGDTYRTNSNSNSVGLLVYGLLSFVYRWFVLVAILSAIVFVFGKSGATTLGYIFSGLLLCSLIWNSTIGTARFARSDQWKGLSMLRSLVSLVVLVGIGWFLCYVPLPCSVSCGVVVESQDPVRIYAASDGRLNSVVANYEWVDEGEVVARLENKSLGRQLAVSRSQLKNDRQKLKEFKLRLNLEPGLTENVSTIEEKIRTQEKAIEILEQQISELKVLAPISGTVFPAVALSATGQADSVSVRSGLVNDRRNTGCYVSRGEHLLTLCDPDDQVISLVVGETDMDWIAVGQSVRMCFEQVPGRTYTGVVTNIMKQDLAWDLSAANDEIDSYIDSAGRKKLTQTPYRVEVGKLELPAEVFSGSTGHAKISVRKMSLAARLAGWIKRSFQSQPN